MISPFKIATKNSIQINEIHYRNIYTDSDEFIEFAFLAENVSADNIGGILLYGSDGKLLFTSAFQQMILFFDEVDPGLGLAVFEYSALPDDALAIALLDGCNNIVQFVSYGGTVTAAEGPAKGAVSLDIGYKQPEDSPTTDSLQRQACRNGSVQSEWLVAGNTRGKLNSLQDVRSCLAIPFVPTAPVVVPTLPPAQAPVMPVAPPTPPSAATPVASPAPSPGSIVVKPTVPATLAPTVFMAPTATVPSPVVGTAPSKSPTTSGPAAESIVEETTNGNPVTFAPPVDDVDTVVVVVAPAHGSVVVNKDGSVSFAPDDDYNGNDTFSAEYCTGAGSCTVQSYSVKVVNNIPNKKGSGKAGWVIALVIVIVLVLALIGLYCFWKKRQNTKKKNEKPHITPLAPTPEQPAGSVVSSFTTTPVEFGPPLTNHSTGAPEELTLEDSSAPPAAVAPPPVPTASAFASRVGNATSFRDMEDELDHNNIGNVPFANAEVAKPGYKDQMNHQAKADSLPEAVASPIDP
jgi:hypothetical protein